MALTTILFFPLNTIHVHMDKVVRKSFAAQWKECVRVWERENETQICAMRTMLTALARIFTDHTSTCTQRSHENQPSKRYELVYYEIPSQWRQLSVACIRILNCGSAMPHIHSCTFKLVHRTQAHSITVPRKIRWCFALTRYYRVGSERME